MKDINDMEGYIEYILILLMLNWSRRKSYSLKGHGMHEEFNGEVMYEVVEVDKEEQFDVHVLVGVK